MKRKQIAFISDHASPLAVLGGVDSGGQNVYVTELAKGLEDLGYDIDIYTRRESEKIADTVQISKHIRVVHISAGPTRVLPKEDLFMYMDEFSDEMIYFMEKEKIRYTLIHAHFWLSGYVAIHLKKKLGIPFVITFHALGVVRRQFQAEADRFPLERESVEQDIIWHAERIIAECPNDMQDLMELYHAPQEKLEIIPCGYSPKDFYPIDKMDAKTYLGLDKQTKYILQLGRIVPRKGIDNVIQAFGELHDSQPNCRLIIVGGNLSDIDHTSEIQRLYQLTQELGIEDKVIFTGNKCREQLKYYYSAAEVFVTTPWYEPFGITPLEAMACGTPVIGSNVGGISFTVGHGKTGLLVTPNRPEELATALRQILSDTKSTNLMRKNCLQRVSERFTWQKISLQIAHLYEELLPQIHKKNTLKELKSYFHQASQIFIKSAELLPQQIIRLSDQICNVLRNGNKIMVCGNGGSAAESQHFVAELVGRFEVKKRPGYPVMALTPDSTLITAWANDFSYDQIFQRQVQALGKPGDMLICLSTSGHSPNIIQGLQEAKRNEIHTACLLGKNGGKAVKYSDLNIIVPSNDTGRIQEIHLHIIHLLCWLIENQMENDDRRSTEQRHTQLIAS